MQKTRKLISMLLAVMMVLSMCTVGMVSASALPENAVISDVEGNDATSIDGELYGLMGDTDANGTINVKDATQIQKFAAKLVELDETSEALADVDLDGKVNVKDATAIQKWVAKYDVDMPINCLVYFPTQETTATEPTTQATVPTSEASEDEPTTAASEDETKPSVPVIVIPTTVATEPTETTTATEPTETTVATEPSEVVTTAEATTAEVTTVAQETEATTVVSGDAVTIYFQNNWMWGDVCAYAWDDAGQVAEWPGVAMTFVENDGDYDIYSYEVPAGIKGIVISGTKDTAPDTRDQTPDILEWYDGQCFYMMWDSSLNQGAGGNAVDSFQYVVPTEATTASTAAEQTEATTASTAAEDTEATTASTTAQGTEATTVADDGMYTIYFTNNRGWEKVFVYAYYGVAGGEATGKPLGDYPGTEMTFVRENQYGQDIYKIDVPADIDNIKFSDGTAENNRTDNIGNALLGDNVGFYLLDKGDKYWPYETYEYAEDTE
ncbi:MAG: starch-binding protein, partial [Ruminococcus sp.]|nr:starch-binding protein [Ruminococcus sp.]